MVDMFSLKDRYKPSTSTKIKSSTSFDYTLLPKKIIKAIVSYSAQHEHELSFEKGDFFHVVGRESDRHWYAVNNPLSNLQGLVPVSCFQVIDKSTRTMNAIQPTLPVDHQHHQHSGNELVTSARRYSTQQQPRQRYYGIVLYDFVAERPDELGCKADETIIVVAQSNKEWYVAKPIGRLGGPGLVPVSFVQLYDLITNHPVLLPTSSHQLLSLSPRSSPVSLTIPKLNEWKKQTQTFEESTIPLLHGGVNYSIDVDPSPHSQITCNAKYGRHSDGTLSSSSTSSSLSEDHHWHSTSSRRQDQRHQSATSSLSASSSVSPSSSPSPALVHSQRQQRNSYESSGSLSRYGDGMAPNTNQHFKLQHSQVHRPFIHSSARRTSIYNPSTNHDTKVVDITANSFIMEGEQYWFVFYATVNNGKHRILYRTYECFYRFHVRLLQEYPIEAGKGDKERILPFMPAPLDEVDDIITEQRREDLDDYCKKLLALPHYLSGSGLIQSDLFGMKKGDVETDYALKKGSRVIKSSSIGRHNGNLPVQSSPQQNISSQQKNENTNGLVTDTKNYGGAAGMVKIKIVYKDDIFAVKISADCTMQELRQRITDRLGEGNLGTMKYKNETYNHKEPYLPLDTEMDMEKAFILAIQHGKLTIVVDS